MKQYKGKAANQGASQARLIKDFLRGGITVTVGGVPIMITLGTAQAQAASARTTARKAAAHATPKPRRRVRRRKSRRVAAPDPRDIRGYLATQMEGSTLTALAQHFKVKRPLMKRMLRRMLDKKEITLFKGAFFNNKRLRRRRIRSPYQEAPALQPAAVQAIFEEPANAPIQPVAEAASPPEAASETVAEAAPTQPTAVPDLEPEEPQTPESLPYPERNAA